MTNLFKKLYYLIRLWIISHNKCFNPQVLIKENTLSDRETILFLKKNPKMGIVRYGNGELGLIVGNSLNTRQMYNQNLRCKLIKCCINYNSVTNQNYLLALPLDTYFTGYSKRAIPSWYPGKASKFAMMLLTKKNQMYASPFCFRIKQVVDSNLDNYAKLVKELFVNRKIIYVGPMEGKNKEIPAFIIPSEIIKIPVQNAFEHFETIIKKIKNVASKYINPLVIIVGGPTASVISYELNLSGITCYDFGQSNASFTAYSQQGKKKIN